MRGYVGVRVRAYPKIKISVPVICKQTHVNTDKRRYEEQHL